MIRFVAGFLIVLALLYWGWTTRTHAWVARVAAGCWTAAIVLFFVGWAENEHVRDTVTALFFAGLASFSLWIACFVRNPRPQDSD